MWAGKGAHHAQQQGLGFLVGRDAHVLCHGRQGQAHVRPAKALHRSVGQGRRRQARQPLIPVLFRGHPVNQGPRVPDPLLARLGTCTQRRRTWA
jgi:hypothetical protein